MAGLTKILVPALGLGLLGALAWEGREFMVARGDTARGTPARDSATVVPQGSRRGASGRIQAEGRIVTYPGAEVTAGSEISGRIRRLTVNEKDVLRRAELIAELDDAALQAAAAEARARLSEAEADLGSFEADLGRLTPLAESGVVPKQTIDRTEHGRDAAVARRNLARASIQRLDVEIAKTRIVAPISGVVIARLANEGETVSPGSPIVRIADLHRVRVEAEVDEYDTHRVAVGDRVTITAEGVRETWRGHIEEIPDVLVARRLNPQDPGRPTDVRVLVVKIALDQTTTLKLGQRVEVAIAPSDGAKPAPPESGRTPP